MRSLRIGIINIPTGAGRVNWERAFMAVLSRADVFGVNEAFNPEAKKMYVEISERHNYGRFGLKSSGNPIFWDTQKYRSVGGEVIEIHGVGPRYNEWPGFNDSRDLTVVVLRPRDAKGDDEDFVVINSHWVPNGDKVPSVWRGRMRAKSKRALRDVVKRADARGIPCFFIGDTNIHGEFVVTKNFEWIKGKPIDKIGFSVPEGMEHGNSMAQDFSAPIDHKNGTVAVARWGRG